MLGSLFRSRDYLSGETELVIIVTPRLSTAAEANARAPSPLEPGREPSAPRLMLLGSAMDRLMEPVVGAEPARQ